MKITIEVWVQSISQINDITSDFHVDIYISESWNDLMLKYGHLNACANNMTLSWSSCVDAR